MSVAFDSSFSNINSTCFKSISVKSSAPIFIEGIKSNKFQPFQKVQFVMDTSMSASNMNPRLCHEKSTSVEKGSRGTDRWVSRSSAATKTRPTLVGVMLFRIPSSARDIFPVAHLDCSLLAIFVVDRSPLGTFNKKRKTAHILLTRYRVAVRKHEIYRIHKSFAVSPFVGFFILAI